MKQWKLNEAHKAYYSLLNDRMDCIKCMEHLRKMFVFYGEEYEKELNCYCKMFSAYERTIRVLELVLFGHKSDIGGEDNGIS